MQSCESVTALQKSWPVPPRGGSTASTNYYYAPVKKGCIRLKSNDTVCGTIKFIGFFIWTPKSYPSFHDIELLPFDKKNKEDVIKITKKNIATIRLYNDTTQNWDGPYEDYVNIDNEDLLWHVYAAKGNCVIYHCQDISFGIEAVEMKLVTPTDTVRMGSTVFSQRKPYPRLNNLLLRFLRRRYHEHFKKKDFKDAQAIAGYILDKENERINGK